MILKKNEEKSKDEEDDIIEVSQKTDETTYFLKIYYSKDKQSIIFKVEQENIQTYYYYEKYQLSDLKKGNNKFNKMNTLTEVYQNIKLISDKSTSKFEIESSNKIKISFLDKSQTLLDFTLRKKVISQNRLNSIIIRQLEENKTKIKSIKKNTNKIEKNINEQNESINDINTKMETISEKLENIIKEIDHIKNTVKNISTINHNKQDKCNDKNNKNKNSKESHDDKHKNTTEIINNKKGNKSCCKIYEFIFMLNLTIIILIAYIFFKLKAIDEKGEIEKQKLNSLKDKYSFLNYLYGMTDQELLYIQNTFISGIIKEKEKEIKNNNEQENKNDIDNNDKNNNFENKNIDEKKKRKYEETKNTMEDSDVFNVDFNE
jgi:hypothetical protein